MKYLNNLNLLQNELQNAVIQNVSTLSGLSGKVGQIVYETTHDVFYIYTDGDGWSLIPNVQTLNADPSTGVIGEIYFNTVDNILKVCYDGTHWKSVGLLISAGTIGEETDSSGLTISNNGSTVSIAHAEVTTTPTDDIAAPDYAETFDVIDGVTVSNGHITGYNTKTITMPSEVSYTIAAEAGTTPNISANLTLTNDLREDVQTITFTTGASSGLDINYDNGNINIAHHDTSTETSVTALTGLQVISEVSLDGFGHITGLDTRNLSLSGLGINLQTVTDEGNTTDNVIEITNDTEATQIGEGALIVSGGASFAKDVFIGGNLTVQGQLTAIQSNEVNIGDSNILLNSEITLASENSNGGLSIKRLAANNTTRADAELEFDTTGNRWNQIFGPTDNVRTSVLPVKLTFTLDDAEDDVVVSDAGKTYTITHNLNTRDLVATIREVADYEVVYTNIEFATVDTLVIRFATAPTAGAYRITIIG